MNLIFAIDAIVYTSTVSSVEVVKVEKNNHFKITFSSYEGDWGELIIQRGGFYEALKEHLPEVLLMTLVGSTDLESIQKEIGYTYADYRFGTGRKINSWETHLKCKLNFMGDDLCGESRDITILEDGPVDLKDAGYYKWGGIYGKAEEMLSLYELLLDIFTSTETGDTLTFDPSKPINRNNCSYSYTFV